MHWQLLFGLLFPALPISSISFSLFPQALCSNNNCWIKIPRALKRANDTVADHTTIVCNIFIIIYEKAKNKPKQLCRLVLANQPDSHADVTLDACLHWYITVQWFGLSVLCTLYVYHCRWSRRIANQLNILLDK